MRGGLRPLAVAAVIAFAAVACSRSPVPNTTVPPRVILLRGAGNEPDSLDPQRARSVEAQEILRDLCEGLTTLDRDRKSVV